VKTPAKERAERITVRRSRVLRKLAEIAANEVARASESGNGENVRGRALARATLATELVEGLANGTWP